MERGKRLQLQRTVDTGNNDKGQISFGEKEQMEQDGDSSSVQGAVVMGGVEHVSGV